MNNIIILDVRTKKEHCSGHICHSINIPMNLPPLSKYILRDFAERAGHYMKINNINREQIIYVYCKKGIRSKEAIKILNKLGYKNVVNIGGIYNDPLKTFVKTNKLLCKC